MSTETEIQTEVEALKARFSDTKTLYREVCALLFFRYDITPTANKLYQYVRRGSMSAPSEALANFWEGLRSKSRVDIDHANLPDALKAVAAEAIAEIWSQANVAARVELATLRDEVSAELAAAKHELKTSQELQASLLQTVEQLREQLKTAAAGAEIVRTELESERRAHAATAARIPELQRQVEALQSQSRLQQEGFSADLAKSREAVEQVQHRADAAERKSMLEIDQERQAKLKAEKLADGHKAQIATLESSARDAALESSTAIARLKAALDAAEHARATLSEDNTKLTSNLEQARGEVGQVREQLVHSQAAASAAQALLDRLAPSVITDTGGTPAKPTRANRRKD